MQRALMQFFKPENWFTVREALIEAGRQDLIGSGCDCLIPAQPPKEAIEARRNRANDPDHYHTVANPAKGEQPGERGLPNQGYRPGRRTARRQDRRRDRVRGDRHRLRGGGRVVAHHRRSAPREPVGRRPPLPVGGLRPPL